MPFTLAKPALTGNATFRRPPVAGAEVAPRPGRLLPSLVLALTAHGLLLASVAAWRLDIPFRKPPPVSAHVTNLALAESGGRGPVGGDTTGTGAGGGRAMAKLSIPALPPRHLDCAVPLPAGAPVPINAVVVYAPGLEVPGLSGAMIGGVEAGAGDGSGTVTGSRGGGEGSGGTGGDGHGLVPPSYVRQPQPRYPSVARQQGWQGTAVLRVEVQTNGRAGAVEVLHSSGHQVLDDAAVDAVRRARFRTDAATWVEVPITFRLNQG